MLILLLIILLVVGIGGWGYASPRYGPAWGISPLGLILLVLFLLYITGNLPLR